MRYILQMKPPVKELAFALATHHGLAFQLIPEQMVAEMSQLAICEYGSGLRQ